MLHYSTNILSHLVTFMSFIQEYLFFLLLDDWDKNYLILEGHNLVTGCGQIIYKRLKYSQLDSQEI
jgi:hypothetical protein